MANLRNEVRELKEELQAVLGVLSHQGAPMCAQLVAHAAPDGIANRPASPGMMFSA